MDMDWDRTNNTKVAFQFQTLHVATPYMFLLGIALAIVSPSILCVYIYMFYKVRQMSVEQRGVLRRQIKLAMCGGCVALFLAFLAVGFCHFSFYTGLMWADNAIFFMISCDLNTYCSVHLLLSTSKVVRKRVCMLALRVFCCKKKVERMPVTRTRANQNWLNAKRRIAVHPIIHKHQIDGQFHEHQHNGNSHGNTS